MGRKQFMQIESTEPSLSSRWANLRGGKLSVCKLASGLASIWNLLCQEPRSAPLADAIFTGCTALSFENYSVGLMAVCIKLHTVLNIHRGVRDLAALRFETVFCIGRYRQV